MIKDRVSQIANYKGIKKEEFFLRIGTTSANFRGKAKNTPLNSSTIENILSEFPDINIEWLITGKGNILKKVPPEQDGFAPKNVNKNSSKSIKIYDINKISSLKSLFDGNERFVIGEISIPNVSACDGAIYINSDCMYPLLKSGDIIIYKKLADPNNIIFGEMYLISITIEDDQYVTIRYINKSDISGYYKLTCYNSNYDPKDILISSIDAIALIKVSIRLQTMF